MRILFMGAGDIALPSFSSLLKSEHEVVALVTQPDRPVGRKQVMQASPIKKAALEAGISVEQPATLKNYEAVACLDAYQADLFVVMAYGQILTQCVIDLPRVACINLHASLLPKYRGASCIQSAILAGDFETGITVMHVVKKLDAGDVILRETLEIGPKETGGELHDRLAELAAQALTKTLEKFAEENVQSEAQIDELSSYAPKLGRADGVIDWSESATKIERKVRAFHPWPGTSTTYVDGKGRKKSLKIKPPVAVVESSSDLKPGQWSAESLGVVQCGEGALRLELVQAEGSREMEVQAFLNGNPNILTSS